MVALAYYEYSVKKISTVMPDNMMIKNDPLVCKLSGQETINAH